MFFAWGNLWLQLCAVDGRKLTELKCPNILVKWRLLHPGDLTTAAATNLIFLDSISTARVCSDSRRWHQLQCLL
ncbi:hypothetical protein GUJ93_ZPchr0013g37931 [Zizania palustris]|uniref:Secreted protein n=1 Tax=Zizania palustris TaxID=103762 RepID=A0A8J5X7Q4_ZIZPA|nr:hypothetical protein GUJ93_ZPchr0013g37931 [Zizania palustris]